MYICSGRNSRRFEILAINSCAWPIAVLTQVSWRRPIGLWGSPFFILESLLRLSTTVNGGLLSAMTRGGIRIFPIPGLFPEYLWDAMGRGHSGFSVIRINH